jgi:hypothetical protein
VAKVELDGQSTVKAAELVSEDVLEVLKVVEEAEAKMTDEEFDDEEDKEAVEEDVNDERDAIQEVAGSEEESSTETIDKEGYDTGDVDEGPIVEVVSLLLNVPL